MGFLNGIFTAVAAVFGWLGKKEENKPGQQKRDEVQTIREERDKNNEAIDFWKHPSA